MAAVLYAIEKYSNDAYSLFDPSAASSSIPALEKLIREYSEDELRRFLLDYASKDESAMIDILNDRVYPHCIL